jgi:hypothetical protein
VAFPIGKPHDFVLERRTISRTDALNLAVVQRTSIDMLAHEIVNPLRRVQQPTLDLISQAPVCRERKRLRNQVSRLFDEQPRPDRQIEVDTVAVQSRRRAGFQSSDLETKLIQRLSKFDCGRSWRRRVVARNPHGSVR